MKTSNSTQSGCLSAIGQEPKLSSADPIAIVGMAMRLPGGITSPEELWEMLIEKRSGRCRVPEDRYNVDAFYSSHPKPGTVCTEYGHFLQTDLKSFDASLFSMTRSEIEKLDPQARFLLEVTREAFERAGESQWRGQNIGCYIGVFGEDWEELQLKDDQDAGMYRLTGYNEFLLSNRISYEYDLKGPSLTIRTGCSSSLIALHTACQAIRQNECRAAIVGGSNLIMSPTTTIAMSEQGLLSSDGNCKTFDSRADGYARGEAINVLYIKRLDDALKDGNPIQAIIRSTASNCDGKTFGLTQPSSQSHEELLRTAHAISGIQNVHETAFVECHGTGTPTGDPLETQAVARVFNEKGIYICSHKPNFGHSEGASGITGVIKTVLALQHRTIPPNINFEMPNPRIPLDMLKVPTEPVAWPEDRVERACVNSFGLGGANATAIIESAASWGLVPRSKETARNQRKGRRLQLLVFSASTSESLNQVLENCRTHIAKKPVKLPNLAYTLGARREHLPVRSFCLTEGFDSMSSAFPLVKIKEQPTLYFVFTGQGAHWTGMGRELILDFPSVLNDIWSMDGALQSLPDPPSWSLLFELLQIEAVTNYCSCCKRPAWDATLTQPLCTALQIALVNLLRSWGIKPEAVVGHSSGEIAAAYASGALSQEEAIIVAYYRGLSVAGLTGSGSMLAVGLGREEVTPLLNDEATIACENSPSNVTLSGKPYQLDQVAEKIREKLPDTFMRKLPVDIAYHSRAMTEVGEKYQKAIQDKLDPDPPSVAFYSSVTGDLWKDKAALGAQYWRDNLESPVLFNTAVQSLLETNAANPIFVEIGPHSALKSPLREISELSSLQTIPYCCTLQRNVNGTRAILQCVGELFTQGSSIDFSALSPGKVLPDLPTYAWHRDIEYWSESRLSSEWRFRKLPHHDLLGNRVTSSSDHEQSWRNILRSDNIPWIRGHQILSDIVFPGAGYVTMVGEAVRQLTGVPDFTVKEMNISAALVIKDLDPVEVLTSLSRLRLTDSLDSSWYEFTISSFSESGWTRRCFGQVRAGPDGEIATPTTVRYPRSVSSQQWYRTFDRVGLQYSHRFRSLTDISADTNARMAAAMVKNYSGPEESQYQLHPSTIDMCLQLIATAACFGVGRNLKGLKVPVSIEYLYVAHAEGLVNLDATAFAPDARALVGDVDAVAKGKTVLKLRGVKMAALDDDSQIGGADPYAAARIHWKPDIDLCDVKDLVKVDFPDERPYLMRLFDKFAFLCCIEAHNKLTLLQPAEKHLHKYRLWLENHMSSVATGKYSIEGGADVMNWTSEQRLSEIEQLFQKTYMYPVGVAILSVFDNCKAIFDGAVEPLDILLKDEILNNLYDLGGAWIDEEYLACLGHAKPGLRILEIGAGTGATTARILPQLMSTSGKPLYNEYHYTDISAGFFVHARERFRDYQDLTYEILDISKDPVPQGFKEDSYDLIVAANVFHATPFLRETVENAYKLLRPGGRILIEELCPDLKWVNFILGVLPGWWMGENDGRHWEPYISPQRWTGVLKEVGFTQSSVVHDSVQPYQMISRIYARKPTGPSRELRPVALLCDEVKQVALVREFDAALRSAGYDVEIQSLFSPQKPNQDVISLLDLEDPIFEDISADSFQALISFLRNFDVDSGLLWCTRATQIKCKDPRWAQVIGFARTARTELGVEMATVEVDNCDTQSISGILKVFEKFREPGYREGYGPEYEWAISEGITYTARFHWVSVASEYAQQAIEVDGPKQLVIGKRGLLDTLAWRCHPRQELGANQIELDVRAVGMNFRDLLVVQGIVPAVIANQIGHECSGVVRQVGKDVTDLAVGDKVVTFTPGTYATSLFLDHGACVKIADTLSFEEAATMGVVYSTVIHSLIHLGRLRKGQSVLIHSACGGVGLAAIQICQMIGATIFATVGNDDKVNHLVTMYGIPKTHIFSSRDSTFHSDLMRLTSNRGVDLVLNSLSGELLHSSWKCVAPYGVMIELGKRDMLGHARLNMDIFESNRSFFGVDIGQICIGRPETMRELLMECMELYRNGSITPISPITTFPAGEIQSAFRFLTKGTHIGKVVVTMPEKSEDLQSLKYRKELQLKPDASYLLVGGLGGLGRAVATWLVERGARNLVFLSRSAGKSIDHEEFFNELQSQGCLVQCFCGSVSNLDDVRRSIDGAKHPVAGIIQMSMVLRDKPLVEMDLQDWTVSVEPKVRGTWNLHEATKSRPLDFMLLFSSLCGLVGQPGQANYAAANTFLDAFAQYRQSLGLPASVLDLGPVEDVGVVSANRQVLANLKATNWHLLSEGEMLDALPLAITGRSSSVCTHHFVNHNQIAVGLRMTLPRNAANNRCVWRHDFRTCAYGNDAQENQNSGDSSVDAELRKFLRGAESDPALLDEPSSVEFLAHSIGVVLHGFLLLPVTDINIKTPMEELGVDSLVSIELRNWCRQKVGVEVTVLEIASLSSLEDFGRLMKSRLVDKFKDTQSLFLESKAP